MTTTSDRMAEAERLAGIEAAANLVAERLAAAPPAVVDSVLGEEPPRYVPGAFRTFTLTADELEELWGTLAVSSDLLSLDFTGPRLGLTRAGMISSLREWAERLTGWPVRTDVWPPKPKLSERSHRASDPPGEASGPAAVNAPPAAPPSTAAPDLLAGAAVGPNVGGGEPPSPCPAERPAPLWPYPGRVDDMSAVCFVDCETTGLDPDRHEIWEVGLIVPVVGAEPGEDTWAEHVWQLPVDLAKADPIALNIGRYHDRRTTEHMLPMWQFAAEFVRLTRGLHLVGACVSFDADRLWRLMRSAGECPMWHYHLVDVEALAAGCLAGIREHGGDMDTARPPWNSGDLSRAVGVDPDNFDRHTALGDARWAKAIYEAVMGS